MSRKEVLAAVRAIPPEQDFVWDGIDEDDRPASEEELQTALESYHKRRGRPAGSKKVSTTVRFDQDVLEAFRATGPGWQSRMNQALKEWIKTHPPA